MKKVYNAVLATLSVMVLFSCSQKEIEPDVIDNGNNTAVEKVRVTFEAGVATKAYIDEDATPNVKWDTDDVIAVWDGTEWERFTAASVNGSSAVFTGEIVPDAGFAMTDFKAVYPYDAVTDKNASAISITVPSAQSVPSGKSIDRSALVAVAGSDADGLLTFHQVCALVKVNVTETGISSIKLGGTGFAGTVVCSADATVSSSVSLEDEVTLTCEDGTFASGDYYIPVLPANTVLSVGFTGESDGLTGTRTTASAVSFERGKARIYIKDSAISSWEYNIFTPDQLVNCATKWSGSFAYPVNICADLDMDGKTWTPDDFAGVFDGKGHKIYNLSIESSSNACFINTLTGTMKDVIFGSSDGTSYDGISTIVQNNPDDGTSWRYVGIVTRLNAAASMSGVMSYIPVTVAATSTSKTRVGGLVGIVATAATGVTVDNCENHGEISILATNPVAAGVAGGLVGRADAPFVCSNSSNFGNITVANASTTYAAGILSSDGAGCTLYRCVNRGNINFTTSGTRAMCVGGILGDAVSSIVNECENYGSIDSALDGELKAGGIVGRAYTDGTITGCINHEEGTITFHPGTTTNQAFIGGIVGNAPADNTGTLTINGCKNYAPLSSSHINVANIAGIAGNINMTSGILQIVECKNYGDITRRVSAKTKGANTDVSVAGIIAYAAVTEGSSVTSCTNHGKIETNTNNGSTTTRIAGIAAYSYQNLAIDSCTNEGEVEYNNSADPVGSTIHIAGIAGHVMRSSVITDCENKGQVSANRRQVNRIGGIVGTLNNSSLSGCTNSGAVSLEVSAELTNWQSVGGIVGFAEGSSNTSKDLVNNENTGDISMIVNTDNARCCVGGIVGMPYTAFNVSGNVNKGTVSGINTHASKPYCYVGGIVGQDNSAGNVSTIADNKSYGEVTNNTGNASYSAAGGLLGNAGKATNITGSVFCSVTGTNAGAVAGVNTTAITATICDAVKVNGVTKVSAADEATWLCPSNTGTIAPTYVAHSDSE
ncbi:MAG: hypothetical protein IKH11_03230 [Bacteroidales bacterium]|nr:hypothetical protein [Bacteroidales bacterium]